jgi:hypothetical protein
MRGHETFPGELGLPAMQKRDIVVCRRSCSSTGNITKLSDFLKSLKEFSLAFQAQKVVIRRRFGAVRSHFVERGYSEPAK